MGPPKSRVITRTIRCTHRQCTVSLYRTLNTRYVCVASLNAESDRRFFVMRRGPPTTTVAVGSEESHSLAIMQPSANDRAAAAGRQPYPPSRAEFHQLLSPESGRLEVAQRRRVAVVALVRQGASMQPPPEDGTLEFFEWLLTRIEIKPAAAVKKYAAALVAAGAIGRDIDELFTAEELLADYGFKPLHVRRVEAYRETRKTEVPAATAELAGLKLPALIERARAAGVGQDALDEAGDNAAPKAAIVALILRAEALAAATFTRSSLRPVEGPANRAASVGSTTPTVLLDLSNIGHWQPRHAKQGKVCWSWDQVSVAFDHYIKQGARPLGIISPGTLRRNPMPPGFPHSKRVQDATGGAKDNDDRIAITCAFDNRAEGYQLVTNDQFRDWDQSKIGPQIGAWLARSRQHVSSRTSFLATVSRFSFAPRGRSPCGTTGLRTASWQRRP